MEMVLLRMLDLLGQSPLLLMLASAVPVAITVAGLAGWRAQVPDTLPLAIWGLILTLWIFAPVTLTEAQVILFRNFVSIIGWLWLVRAWGRLVLTEWPAPIWSHWIVGTLLALLPLCGAVVLIRGL
ncbi:MAG: hypothetical protein CFE34_12650 [Rhodobacteraceae bacterium PARR1]|nr:MAG: hypothetical protein CFE34_12650 [Rhodobacteraceae bacterium PARR1]